MSTRSLALGGTSYPVTLPSLRDPRLHVAAVIVTIHVLGQTTLHFQVTVPQILSAILTCAVIEVAITFRTRRALAWPASAMPAHRFRGPAATPGRRGRRHRTGHPPAARRG